METTVNRTKRAPFIILAIIILAACAVFFTGFGGYMHEAAAASGMTLGIQMILYYLYLYGGMMVACIVVLMLMVLLLKNKREFFAKIFVWGAFLLAMLASAGFFGNLVQVSSFTTTEQGVAYFATYIPYVVVVVSPIALIVQWDSSSRRAVNLVSLVSLMVSAVLTVLLIANIMTQMQSMLDTLGTIQTAYIYQYMFMIAIGIICTLMCALYFSVTLDRRKFDCNMIGMTDEEAAIVERIEARVDEIAEEVEELAAEGEAVIAEEKKIEEAKADRQKQEENDPENEK